MNECDSASGFDDIASLFFTVDDIVGCTFFKVVLYSMMAYTWYSVANFVVIVPSLRSLIPSYSDVDSNCVGLLSRVGRGSFNGRCVEAAEAITTEVGSRCEIYRAQKKTTGYKRRLPGAEDYRAHQKTTGRGRSLSGVTNVTPVTSTSNG